MKSIKYRDKITKQRLEFEVDDEIANFLMASDRKIRRKQAQYNYYNISLNSPVYSDNGKEITLEDTIAEPEETFNCKICRQQMKFYNVVWKVVLKLDKYHYDIVWDYYVEKKSQKRIAKELNITESAVSQLLSTSLQNLIFYFNTDKDFTNTNFYKRYYNSQMLEVAKISNEFISESGLKVDILNIDNLVKTGTQVIKKLTTLNTDIDDKQKELFSTMNKTNRDLLKNIDNKEQSEMIIPTEFLKLIKGIFW